MKKFIKNLLKKLDIVIIRNKTFLHYKKLDSIHRYLLKIPNLKWERVFPLLDKSKSQIYQDIFVLNELGYKSGGFFVEFGATNGVNMSNTFLLEKEFNWKGILAEPAKCWHESLKKNRNCSIDTNCLWRNTGSKLSFEQVGTPEYSTLKEFVFSDFNNRKSMEVYTVETISLEDLLEKYDAPFEIDYLSIDTEGSEFEILNAFDFNKYNIKVITCEHNFTEAREKIYNLLTANGYSRKFTELSRWDDWYVKL